MNRVCRAALVAALAVIVAVPAAAQQAQQPPATPPAAQKPDPQKPDPQKPDEPQKYEETVVVSGSRTETTIMNAPATMSVIGAATIEQAPSRNFAELLRAVPGVNVTQVSARDINITSRAATGTLATGQLALLDGRSLYQDFFGFVMWDFLPVDLNEIKQIEVVRGPASAIWGANAVYGVVNVITKSPREMQGTRATLGFGTFDRDTAGTSADAGGLWYVSGTHAQAIDDRWAFKLSAGTFSQDPLTRPTGIIPGSIGNREYPAYANTGTTQPKFDARLDYDYPDGRKLTFSGGVAGTEGIMHSGIGPFDINSGTVMGYAKVDFTRKAMRAGFFTNILDGDADNLLTRTPTNDPIGFAFSTKTFDFDISNVSTIGTRHAVSYGGNLRFNKFEMSLAPGAEDRTEFGIYGQDEIFLSDHFRWVVGARLDRFDFIDDVVVSPRTTLLIKPRENHTVRLSYNRAYRSPSVINNFLDITIAEPIDLTPFAALNPAVRGRIYPLPVRSVGDPNLRETSLDAYEIGYTGVLGGRTVLSAAFYVNKTKDDILFTEVEDERYSPTNPPPGFAFGLLPPIVIGFIPPDGTLPALFTYENFGKTTQKGLELGIDTPLGNIVNAFVNYSWQAEPEPEGFEISELNLPARHRFNVGANFTYNRVFGNLSVSYSDGAFWQDVLDARFHGRTDAYTMVNGGFGVNWAGQRFTTAIKAINLGNDEVQQHVFGDIVKRQIVGEMRVRF
jgi:outer membrane receptor protein involved in Fe transport